ncbi:HpcH/HpaI aldolase/citrate lyase family protein [Pseudoxanthomonas sacheonensis]|uniref:Citrate lyase subunit beta/citryl-CoA lyase n=1 Tax=Pseudoxanthomonas sacheonensis TaxID=443615 RepID=A0ABU1RVJ5_9GAMM|nr:CoA ester lyase [Pseudoxanthomonas sacheonensis]MDR6842792.1 citrate lyase subunit beta/citryl-CoA lyase [Pseudoxanthomonas sacheonensis]
MRSKLFVPGARPELFAKALAGDADALSFDLEDSVPETRKAEARASVAEFLRSPAVRAAAKVIVVRLNALDTPHFEADVQAVAQSAVALLNLPKVESAEDIRAAVAVLERVEAGSGIDRPIRLLATIETPRGLRRAADIAGAHPRVAGLQLGLADLFQPFGIDRGDAANVHATLFAMRMAAAEAGVFAWDAAFADLEDAEGFRAEASMARRLGYLGKSCVHPKQVALANEVFQPDAQEIAAARRIVAAAREAGAQGRGAFVVDGRMIDLPFLKRAEAILASLDSSTSAS